MPQLDKKPEAAYQDVLYIEILKINIMYHLEISHEYILQLEGMH